jgi:transcriptional regulator with XRE-family HTH domain
MFTPSNASILASAIRAGRVSLGWSQAELSARSNVSLPTITRIELAATNPRVHTIGLIFNAMEQAGVSFVWTEPEKHFVMSVATPPKPAKRR